MRMPSRLRGNSGDECNRSGEDQRTRGCSDQYGQPAYRISGEQPCIAGKKKGEEQRRSMSCGSASRMNGAFAVCAAVTMRTMPA